VRAIPFPDPPLGDGDVRLRAKRRGDSAAIAAAMADPEIPRWTSIRHPYGIEEADLWFDFSEQMRLDGRELSQLIVDDADRLLGMIGLMFEKAGEAPAEIGYWVAAPARGRGVAPRAVALLRDWAARELGIHRVVLSIHVDNAASRRAAVKAGFADTGERREPPLRCEPGGARSHAVYAWERDVP
jgi:RimJ/RimL family protein N-acetyltransferase